jgi:hypothetical protein
VAVKSCRWHAAKWSSPVGRKCGLYKEPDVKDQNGEPVVTRVLTIILAEEY